MRVTQSEQMLLKNGANRPDCCRVATNLQSVNNATSTKCNKARYTRTGNERGAITTDSIKRIMSYVTNNFMPIK